MKQEHKDAWLEALRSGEYQQTTGTLRSPNREVYNTDTDETEPRTGEVGYCCLGVLCDVVRRQFPDVLDELGVQIAFTEEGGLRQTWTHRNDLPTPYEAEDEHVLAAPLAHWAGMSEEGRLCAGHDDEGDEIPIFLAEKNDHGATFAEIADVIEEHLAVTE